MLLIRWTFLRETTKLRRQQRKAVNSFQISSSAPTLNCWSSLMHITSRPNFQEVGLKAPAPLGAKPSTFHAIELAHSGPKGNVLSLLSEPTKLA